MTKTWCCRNVGRARSATLNSAAFTKKIANDLASLNFNIVSGLALGVDAAAHSVVYSGFCTTAAKTRYHPPQKK